MLNNFNPKNQDNFDVEVQHSFADLVAALPDINAGIWSDTDPKQSKMNSFLTHDLFSSPRFRENAEEAELL